MDEAMDDQAVRTLARLLLYGTAESRRRLAARYGGDGEALALLVATARSDDRWLLRARALEALGLVAGSADQALAERILTGLLGEESAPQDGQAQVRGHEARRRLDDAG